MLILPPFSHFRCRHDTPHAAIIDVIIYADISYFSLICYYAAAAMPALLYALQRKRCC